MFPIVAILDLNISQGNVDMHLKSDGIFNNDFIANFLFNLSVKEIENRSAFCEVIGKIVFCFFLTRSVIVA